MFDNVPNSSNMLSFFGLLHPFRGQDTVKSLMFKEEENQPSGYAHIALLLLTAIYFESLWTKSN